MVPNLRLIVGGVLSSDALELQLNNDVISSTKHAGYDSGDDLPWI